MSDSSHLTLINRHEIRGRTLRDILSSQGRYQSWIAEAMGLSRSFVNAWISGSAPMTETHAIRLASLIAIDPDEILAASRASQIEFHAGRLRELGVDESCAVGGGDA